MPRLSDKRERLVDAARSLFYTQGFKCTSLADIANESGVPLGNVYYYFKTKEDLAESVIGRYSLRLQKLFEQVSDLPDPRERLIGMLELLSKDMDQIVSKGCPMGSLCMEFCKGSSILGSKAADLLESMMDFFEAELLAMGRTDAREFAAHLVSVSQGASLLAQATCQKDIFRAEMARLQRLVRELD